VSPGRRPAGRAHLALVAAAFCFGSTFVVVKDAVKDAGPVPFLAVRFSIGAAVMWPLARRRPRTPGWAVAGLWCGLALLVGYVFQTVGLQYTSSSRSALITYLLIVIVPVMSAVRARRPPAPWTIAGVCVSLTGLFLLNGGSLAFGQGEALTLVCALAFAVHIVLLADLSPRHDTLRLTAVQLAVVAAGCAIPGLFTGGYHFTARAWFAAAYTGVGASAIAFGFMVWAQRRVGPERAALVLMLEPVFAAVAGYLVGDRLGASGVVGAALILLGIGIAEGTELLATRPRALDQSVKP
jgi:drug/metabolite transporter (DMT)-like permease